MMWGSLVRVEFGGISALGFIVQGGPKSVEEVLKKRYRYPKGLGFHVNLTIRFSSKLVLQFWSTDAGLARMSQGAEGSAN